MIQILNTPIYRLFFDLISSTKHSIKLCAPFIKNNIIKEIYSTKNTACSLSVITSVKLNNYYRKLSDLQALGLILQNKGKVYNYQGLHAKIFIFDDECSIITSANLTNNGLAKNYEYGIILDDKAHIKTMCQDFQELCHHELAGKLRIEQVEEMQKILDAAPKSEKVTLAQPQLTYDEDIYDKDINTITEQLNGWKKAVFIALQNIQTPIFNTQDFAILIPQLQKQYPRNKNIEAKIRQQLQELRDLGLVNFESRGEYKKLWL